MSQKEGIKMRKRMISATLLLAMTMSVSLLNGCAENTVTNNTNSSGSTIYGVVREVSDDSLTIEEGTIKAESENTDSQKSENTESNIGNQKSENSEAPSDDQNKPGEMPDGEPPQGQPDGQPPEGQPDGQPPQGGPGGNQEVSAEDYLDLTGEEKTFSVSEDTTVTSSSIELLGTIGSEEDQDQKTDSDQAEADNKEATTDQAEADNKEATTDQSEADNKEATTDQAEADNKETTTDQAETGNQEAASEDTGSTDDKSTDDASKKMDMNEEQVDELSDLEEGDLISIEVDEDGNATIITVLNVMGGPGGAGGPGQGGPGNGGQSSQPDNYDAATQFVQGGTVSGETYTSTGTDENAVLIDEGAELTLEDVTITRESDDSTGGDSSSFYGVGAALLTKEGTAYVKGGTVTTDAAGGAGIFSYGDKSVTYVSDTEITTKQGTSGGIHVAGGGTLYAWDVTAETSGESSAALRSDRGGGTMVVDGGSYTSNGTGSPAVYTTADITVNDAELTATGSEAVCIEGLNSLRLFNSIVTGNMPDNEQNDCTWNVILYQSMSGDSEEGNSTFYMEDGKLIGKNGGMFYTTNTESTFVLKNVDIQYAKENDFFLKCTGNSNQRGWGSAGKNGADCTFTAIDQDMEGDVIWDSISQLDFYMTDGSTLKGAVIDDESNAGSTSGDGYCNLVISKDSTWTVTGDSVLSSLSSEGSIVDENGKTVTIKGTDGTVYVKGDSQYTITVDKYSDTADLEGASSDMSYEDYAVEKPAALQ